MGNQEQSGVQRLKTKTRSVWPALCAVLFLLAGGAGAFAEEEDAHDHGAAPRNVDVAPRAEARIGNQEIVIAYERDRLVLFLQRYSDGQPTPGAELAITVDFVPVAFKEIAPGTYITDNVMLAAGHNDLELTYKIGDREGTETIPLTLLGGSVQKGTARIVMPSSTTSGLLLAVLAFGIYIAVSALLAFRSRSRAA